MHLRNWFDLPYDDAIAAARTCYSPRVIAASEVTPDQRGRIGALTYAGGHHTVFQHATFEFSLEGVTALPRVDIVMAYENMDGALIDASAAAGAKGIVVAGVGNGNLTEAAVKALAGQAQKGVICVRSSRVVTGIVGRNVELDDDKLGFVASLDKTPPKARVLLRLALLKPRTAADVQRIFDEY